MRIDYINKKLVKMNPQTIAQVLQNSNRNFFYSKSMNVDLLKNCPEVVPILAEWLYREWGSYDTSLTEKKLIDSFSSRLNDDRIPLTFVVLKKAKAIATISLKKKKALELSHYSDNTIWLGGLQVSLEERNQGIGEELIKCAASCAKQLGYDKLYFYTSNPINVSWYLKRGALFIEELPFRNHRISILSLPVF